MFKHFRFLLLFVLVLVLFSSPAGQTTFSTFFGPVTYIRSTGKPIIEATHFTTEGFSAPYILHLRSGDENGANRVSSARIWLNGKLLFKQSDFSQQVWAYDYEVDLNEQNELKVQIASAPGSELKIWIEGIRSNNIPNVVLDEANKVVSFISNIEGGVIEIDGLGGIHYTLELPPGAFWEEEGQAISMTPILDIDGLPSDGPFVAGVRLEPDGLRLLKPATLRIEMPSNTTPYKILGICYNGPKGQYYAVPFFSADQNNSMMIFHLLHFSDWVGYATENCPGAYPEPVFTSDIYIHALGCALQSNEAWRAYDILFNWYYELVYPELTTANDLDEIQLAIQQFLLWDIYVQSLGLEDEFEAQVMVMRTEIQRVLETAISSLNQECKSTTDWCEKRDMFNLFLQWASHAELLLNEYEIQIVMPDTHDFCEKFINNSATSIEVGIQSDTLYVGDSMKCIAVLKDVNDHQIFNSEVDWSIALEDRAFASIDSVYVDEYGVNSALIKGLEPGLVTVNATAKTGCILQTSKEISVEAKIVVPVASVEINPEVEAVRIGELKPLVATVKDAEGNPILGLPVTWASAAPSIAEVDAIGMATGVAGGWAWVSATCGGVTGWALVGVPTCDKFVFTKEIVFCDKSFLQGINNAGHVIGQCDTMVGEVFREEAFIYFQDGTVTWLGYPIPEGGEEGDPKYDIDESGQPFINILRGINVAGHSVGVAPDNNDLGFYRAGDYYVEFRAHPGEGDTLFNDINDFDQIVGYSDLGELEPGFILTPCPFPLPFGKDVWPPFLPPKPTIPATTSIKR